MAKNYVIYDNNGLLADSELKQISKGNNKVDSFYIAFTGYDYATTYVTVAVTLPDGNSLPQLATSINDFMFSGTNYRGYKLLVTDALTSQAGVVTMTFWVKSREDDRRLCSGQLNITIHDSDVYVEPTITTAQYENVLLTIDETAKELDEKKLDKDFIKYQSITEPSGFENLALYTSSGETRRILVEDFYNIHEINGVTPENKKITLTANDIHHNEKLVGDYLDDINEEVSSKANADETVFYRNGTLDNILDIRPTGVLNHATEVYESGGYTFARILLTDTNFEDGDIVSCDVSVTIKDGSSSLNSNFSFTRVLEVGSNTIDFYQVIPNGSGDFVNVQIYGGVENNILGFRMWTPENVTYLPTITYSIVRRG